MLFLCYNYLAVLAMFPSLAVVCVFPATVWYVCTYIIWLFILYFYHLITRPPCKNSDCYSCISTSEVYLYSRNLATVPQLPSSGFSFCLYFFISALILWFCFLYCVYYSLLLYFFVQRLHFYACSLLQWKSFFRSVFCVCDFPPATVFLIFYFCLYFYHVAAMP